MNPLFPLTEEQQSFVDKLCGDVSRHYEAIKRDIAAFNEEKKEQDPQRSLTTRLTQMKAIFNTSPDVEYALHPNHIHSVTIRTELHKATYDAAKCNLEYVIRLLVENRSELEKTTSQWKDRRLRRLRNYFADGRISANAVVESYLASWKWHTQTTDDDVLDGVRKLLESSVASASQAAEAGQSLAPVHVLDREAAKDVAASQERSLLPIDSELVSSYNIKAAMDSELDSLVLKLDGLFPGHRFKWERDDKMYKEFKALSQAASHSYKDVENRVISFISDLEVLVEGLEQENANPHFRPPFVNRETTGPLFIKLARIRDAIKILTQHEDASHSDVIHLSFDHLRFDIRICSAIIQRHVLVMNEPDHEHRLVEYMKKGGSKLQVIEDMAQRAHTACGKMQELYLNAWFAARDWKGDDEAKKEVMDRVSEFTYQISDDEDVSASSTLFVETLSAITESHFSRTSDEANFSLAMGLEELKKSMCNIERLKGEARQRHEMLKRQK